MSKKTENKELDLKHIRTIKKNYQNLETAIVNQLFFEAPHGGMIGGYREEIWKSLFEKLIPQKFSIVRSVFIIDSHGKISKEVDLAIIDEQFTPYIFNDGVLKFVPIEAVSAVVECKSKTLDKKFLKEWVDKIEGLETSTNSFARMTQGLVTGAGTSQTGTRPIRILCYVRDSEFKSDEVKDRFDFVIAAKEEDSCLIIERHERSLHDWFRELNQHKPNQKNNDKKQFQSDAGGTTQKSKCCECCSCKFQEEQKDKNQKTREIVEGVKLSEYVVKNASEKEISILSLVFQFNQLLMLINNPMLFPHKSYTDLFNSKEGDEKSEQ